MTFKILYKIPRTIKAIGIVSFLLNTSTLMVYSIFGLYLSKNLGVALDKIGFLDGAVESFSFIIKIFSGVLSDFVMNRKLLIMVGAFLLFIAKPLEAISVSYWNLFYAKILERLGNGIQATPRDAIVGDWAPQDLKGASFGFRQTLAALGSVAGAVIAFILLQQSKEDFQFVFWMASIPSFIAILVILFIVKDKKLNNPINTDMYKNLKVRKISLHDIKNLDPQYWITIIVASTYMVAKVTESIVILHIIQNFNLPTYYGPLCMVFYQLANSFISFPAGIISDKLKNRDNVILSGIIIFLISDILFIFGNHMAFAITALILLGAYIGISQSIFQAKIMDIVPVDLKGTGIGIFNCACAISLIIGGTLSGYLADKYSTTVSFISSSLLAVLSIIVLLISKNKIHKHQ